MPDDRMSKDIRARVKAAVKTSGRYAAGTGKLFLASGKEFFTAQMPAVTSSFETNKELIDDTVKFLRNPIDSISKRVDRAIQSDNFKELERFARNALDDLKTGNLYDPNRDRSEIGMQIDDMLSDFGGFDMTGFDENGEWSESSFDDKGLEGDIKIAEVQEQNADKRTVAMLDAMGTSTNAIIANDNANAQRKMKMDLRYHSQQMGMMQNMITAQTSTFELLNKSVQASLEVTREAHNQIMTEMGDIKNLLSQIVTNTTPVKPEEKKYRSPDEIFGTNGELNIKNYLKRVVKNVDEYYGLSSAVNMATGGLDFKTLISTVADNPWQIITDLALARMIPEKTKRQMSNTNKNLASFLPALFQKWNQRGKKYENGEGNFMDMIAGLFGIRQTSRSSIDTEYENPLAAANFTAKTTRAIEEVIPMWLSKIYSAVSGDELQVYNYTTGRLEKASGVVAKSRREARDLVGRMGEGASTIMQRAGLYKFKNSDEQTKFEDFIYQYLQKQAEDNSFIDPYSKDFYEDLPSVDNAKFYAGLLRGILRKMPRDQLMSLSNEIVSARASRDRNTVSLNKSLKDSGGIAAYGFMDDDLIRRIEGKVDITRQSLSEDQISNLSREYQQSIRSKTGYAATNVLLNDILGTLKKGIITYSYNIGKATHAQDVRDIFQSVHKTAADQREIENKLAASAEAERKAHEDRMKRESDEWDSKRKQSEGAIRDWGVTYDWNEDDAALFQEQWVIDNTKIGESNNPIAEKDRKLLEDQKKRRDALKNKLQPTIDMVTGKVDEASKKSGMSKLFGYMKMAAEEPFRLFNSGMQIMDAFMFKALFGQNAASQIDWNDSEPYLLQVLGNSLKNHFNNFKDWFAKNIGDPMKNYLFDKETGLLPRIGSAVAEVLGVEDLKTGIKNKVGAIRDKADAKIRGTKGEDGKWSGGALSSTLNKFKEVDANAKDITKNALIRVLYGDMADTKGVKTVSDMYLNDDGVFVGASHKEYSGIVGGIKKGFDSFKEMMFGPEDIDTDSKRKFKTVKEELNKAFPDMVVNGGIGALASIFLPGGPILGAAIGSTVGLIKGSDKLNSFLFGEFSDTEEEIILDKNGNPVIDRKTGQPMKRKKQSKSGLIDREVGDAFKKFLPAGAKGAALGVIGSMFLPGGPVLGGVLGALGGMAGASEKMKEVLFGNVTDPKSGLISKEFREKVTASVKKYAPFTVAGGALGGMLGAGLGVIPGLSLLPTGPVFAIMGSLMGFANSDKLEKFFFGESVEQEVESTDANGNKTKTKKVIREGGLFGGIHDFVKDKLITPFGKKVNAAGEKIGNWFEDSIIAPLRRSTEGFHKQISEAGSRIKESLNNIGQKITDGITGVFEKAFGVGTDEDGKERKGLKQLFQEKLFKPLENMMDRMLNAIGSIIGKVIAAPFKAFEMIVTGKSGADELDREDRSAKREAKWQSRRDKAHDRHLKKAGGLFSKAGSYFRSAFTFGTDKNGNIKNATTMGGAVTMPGETVAADATNKPRYAQNSAGRWYDTQTGRLVSQKVVYESGQIDYMDAKWTSASDEKADKTAKDKSSKSRTTKDGKSTSKSDKLTDEEVNRQRTSRRLRSKSNNEYLADIAKYSKKTYEELRGQVNGVGWNTAYIMTLLQKQYGELDDSELPEEMEGSKRKIRKKRTIFGRAKDAVSDWFTDKKEKIGEKLANAKSGIGKFFHMIFHPFQLLGEVAGKAGKALGAFGKALWEGVKTVGSALGEILKGMAKGLASVLEGAGKLIAGAAKGIGESIGNAASTLTGVLKDLTLGVSAGVRGLFEIVADIAPDIAHAAWKGVSAVGKGMWKGAKAVGRGVGKGLKWAFNKITGRNNEDDEASGVAKKVKEKIKNIGTFRIDGGKLDEVDSAVVKIGEPVNSVYYPWVMVTNGKAVVKSRYAIPVYILGAETAATVNTRIMGGSPDNIPAGGSPDNQNSDPTKTPITLWAGTEGVTTNAAGETVNVTRSKVEALMTQFNPKANSDIDQIRKNTDDLFVKHYARVDKQAESSKNSAQIYDRAISKAKSREEIEAIALAQQMNANSTVIETKEGEKSEGFLDKLLGLFGKGGSLATLLTSLIGTGGAIAYHLANGDGTEAAKLGTNSLLNFSGLKNVKAADLLNIIKDPSTAAGYADDILKTAAESGSKKATRKATRTAKGIKVLGKVADGAKGLIDNAKKAIKKVVDAFFSNNTVKKAFGPMASAMTKLKTKLVSALSGSVLESAMKKVGKATAAATAKLAAAVGTGGLLAIGFAIADFVSGMSNARKYFDVYGDDVTLGMRLTAGVCDALTGLLTYIPVVGGPLSIAVSLFMDSIVQLVYDALASDDDKNALKENQAQLKADTDAYNAANGTNLTVDQYAKEFKSDGTQRGNIFKRAGRAIASGATAAWTGTKNFFSKAGTTIKDGFNNAKAKVGDFFGNVGSTIKSGYNKATTSVKDFFGGVKEKYDSINGDTFMEKFMTYQGAKARKYVDFFKSIPDTFDKVVDSVGGFFTDTVPETFKKVTNKVSGFFTQTVPDTFNKAVDGVSNFVTESIPNAFNNVKTKVGNFFNTTLDSIGNFFGKVGTGIKDTFNNTVDFVKSIPGKVVDSAKTTWNNVKDKVSDVKDVVKDKVSQAKDKVSTIWGNIKSGVSNTLQSWGNAFNTGYTTGNVYGTGKMKRFSQTSGKWNRGSRNIADNGCGPTVAATIATAYGRNANPMEADAMSYASGMRAADGGTNPAFFKHYAASKGFGMEQGPTSSGMVESNLRKGRPVVLMGRGGDFGSGMHYLVADKVTGRGRVNIIDPITGANKSSSLGSLMRNTSSTIYSYGRGPVANTATMANDGGGTSAVADDVEYRNNFPFYLQGDARWGSKMYSSVGNASQTMKNSACGPTAAAMVLRSYGIPVDPPGVADWSVQRGHRTSNNGTAWAMFPDIGKEYGLDVGTVGASQLVSTLESGVPVVAIMKKGHFTNGGHYISLVGTRNGQILVNDPASTSRTDQLWDPSIFAAEGRNFWTFKKNGKGSINNLFPLDVSQRAMIGGSTSGTTGTYQSMSSSSSRSTKHSGSGMTVLNALSDMFSNVGNLFSNLLNKLSLDNSSADSEDMVTDESKSTAASSADYGTHVVPEFTGSTNAEKLWNFFKGKGLTNEAIAGIMGNIKAESNFEPTNLQNSYEKSLGFTDDSYTKAVDNKSYTNFVNDAAGYGLAQWTYYSRKQKLLDYARANGLSIGDLGIQAEHLYNELGDYGLLSKLNGMSVFNASKTVLQDYEKPAGWDKSETINKRAAYAQSIYDAFKDYEAGSYGTGTGRWGRGNAYNLTALNNRVNSINNTITKIKEEASEGSTVAQVTNAITKAVTQTAGEGGATSTDMLNVLTQSLATMIELLSAIKDNTASKDDERSANGTGTDLPTARANDIIRSQATPTPNQNNSGAKIMDVLTSK